MTLAKWAILKWGILLLFCSFGTIALFVVGRLGKKPPWKRNLFTICIFVSLTALIWSLFHAYRALTLYSHAKGDSRGWSTPAHRADAVLGFCPIPGVRSAEVFPIGPDVSMGFDEEGFRLPLTLAQRKKKRPHVLALGCSHTYGVACAAEETFPFKVAASLGGTELNAGVCSSGLSQMMLLAERLIPEHRPDYVLVQYSPWLVDRSVKHFAPTYFSLLPNPFFADGEDGGVVLQSPVFSFYDLDLSSWRGADRGVFDFTSFLFRAAYPLYLHDDVKTFSYCLRSMVGQIKQPTTNRSEVLKTVYGRIQELCSVHGANAVVVVLGKDHQPVSIPLELDGFNIVNSHSMLLSMLPDLTVTAYRMNYGHFRGSPPVLVDVHPNPQAHTLIAKSIIGKIESIDRQPTVIEFDEE